MNNYYDYYYLCEVNSRIQFVNGLFQVLYGNKKINDFLYDTVCDQIVKQILFN